MKPDVLRLWIANTPMNGDGAGKGNVKIELPKQGDD